ncbi:MULTISPECIES: hypothetical protein [Bacillaceae]|uniref:hypothetical protein n=1 Tax=Bacillaceae TaxID=186817 RepID=UPI000C27C10B|nr:MULTISPECIES: hypothetical protein [Bacillaceae]PJN88411.1 hypothetical protein CVN76_20815 [Bacillus sp. mrc49]
MKLLTGTLALSVSFILFIYLYGLKVDSSIKYNATFYTFPALLFFIALFCFVSLMVNNNKD